MYTAHRFQNPPARATEKLGWFVGGLLVGPPIERCARAPIRSEGVVVWLVGLRLRAGGIVQRHHHTARRHLHNINFTACGRARARHCALCFVESPIHATPHGWWGWVLLRLLCCARTIGNKKLSEHQQPRTCNACSARGTRRVRAKSTIVTRIYGGA